MWSLLIGALLSIGTNVLLPALLKWLGLFEQTLAGSAAAKKLLKENQPATYEEFAALWPKLVDLAQADANLKASDRVKFRSVAILLGREKLLRAVWNRFCLDPKAAKFGVTATTDVGYLDMLQEARRA